MWVSLCLKIFWLVNIVWFIWNILLLGWLFSSFEIILGVIGLFLILLLFGFIGLGIFDLKLVNLIFFIFFVVKWSGYFGWDGGVI